MTILRIYRSEGNYDIHHLDIKPETKLLTLFEQIRVKIDSSFAFSSECRRGICGSCAVKVNGIPVLACKAEIGSFRSGVLRIEPLNSAAPKIDLLSDFEPFFRSFSRFPEFPPPDGGLTRHCEPSDALRCTQCGICFYSCPSVASDDGFAGPAAIVKAERFLSDPADRLTRPQLEAAAENVYQCVKCFRCEEYCPRGLKPEHSVEAVRRRCLTLPEDSLGTIHTKALFDSIFHYGKINEVFTARYIFGFCGSLPLILSGIPFLLKRRVRLRPVFSKNIREIRQLLGADE